MIDWLTFTIEVAHKKGVFGGFRTNLDEKRNLRSEFTTFAILQGTHESRLMVKSQNEVLDTKTGEPMFTQLFVTGNPVKVLQGHNIFGTDDVHALTYAITDKIIKFFALDIDIQSIKVADVDLKKVDVNYSFNLPNQEAVERWINSAERSASIPYAGRGVLKSSTSLVFSESSKHWRLKAYGKHKELMARSKTTKLLNPDLVSFTKNLLRVELEAKRILKNDNLNNLNNWTMHTPRKLFNEYLSKMNITDNLIVPDDKLKELTPSAQAVYMLWLEGHEMKTLYANRQTFYSWRNKLIKQINVDIALTRKGGKGKIKHEVPLVEYIKAEPLRLCDIPESLKKENYFEPLQEQRFVA